MAIHLTEENFDQHVLVENNLPTIVDFWAEWCGPCRMIGPILDELSKEYEGKAVITKVSVDDNPNLTMKYQIKNIPTMLFFKNGKEMDKIIGAANRTSITQKLDALM